MSSNVTNAIHADNATHVANVINFINVASETNVVSIMKDTCPTLGRCLLPWPVSTHRLIDVPIGRPFNYLNRNAHMRKRRMCKCGLSRSRRHPPAPLFNVGAQLPSGSMASWDPGLTDAVSDDIEWAPWSTSGSTLKRGGGKFDLVEAQPTCIRYTNRSLRHVEGCRCNAMVCSR